MLVQDKNNYFPDSKEVQIIIFYFWNALTLKINIFAKFRHNEFLNLKKVLKIKLFYNSISKIIELFLKKQQQVFPRLRNLIITNLLNWEYTIRELFFTAGVIILI